MHLQRIIACSNLRNSDACQKLTQERKACIQAVQVSGVSVCVCLCQFICVAGLDWQNLHVPLHMSDVNMCLPAHFWCMQVCSCAYM